VSTSSGKSTRIVPAGTNAGISSSGAATIATPPSRAGPPRSGNQRPGGSSTRRSVAPMVTTGATTMRSPSMNWSFDVHPASKSG